MVPCYVILIHVSLLSNTFPTPGFAIPCHLSRVVDSALVSELVFCSVPKYTMLIHLSHLLLTYLFSFPLCNLFVLFQHLLRIENVV